MCALECGDRCVLQASFHASHQEQCFRRPSFLFGKSVCWCETNVSLEDRMGDGGAVVGERELCLVLTRIEIYMNKVPTQNMYVSPRQAREAWNELIPSVTPAPALFVLAAGCREAKKVARSPGLSRKFPPMWYGYMSLLARLACLLVLSARRL